jgi:hypothetical protein
MENLGFGANPYLQSTIDAALGDTVRAFNMGVSPSIRSSMVRSGSFGNSGLEQMSGEAERQLQQNLGRQANEMRFNDFWQNQNFGRTLFQDAQQNNLNNASFGLGLLGTLNQFNQQDLNNANQVQNTPMNYWQNFTNSANAVGQGFGTQQSNMNMQGSPLMGALGGAQLGGMFGKMFKPDYSGSAGGNSAFPEWGMASGATGGWV